MFRNARFLSVLCLAAGIGLGYAAANGYLNPSQWANAATTGQNQASVKSGDSRSDGTCCDGVNKGQLQRKLTDDEVGQGNNADGNNW